jgi:hypothetical protein
LQTTQRRFISRILGASLIVVGLAGVGLLWTLGEPEERSRSAGQNDVSMNSAPTSEPSSPPAATPALPAPTVTLPAVTVESAASDGVAPARKLAHPASVPTSPAKSAAPAAKTGKIQFAIKPWGEIVIDGKKRGVSPPIKELSIPEGRHRIEIRNSTSRGYAREVDVTAGRSVSIAHSFTSP